MIATATMTQTKLRIELVNLEMQSLIDRSLKDELLNRIIDYCVPLKYLAAFTIWGMEQNEAHMRLDVQLDYDEYERQVKLSGDGLPEGLAGAYSLSCGPAGGGGAGTSQPAHCPHMGKALDLYIRLAREKGLRLDWSVRFRENRRELCEKFGLTPAFIHDCTSDAAPNSVTNSLYAELTMTGRMSHKVVPPG